MNIVLIHPPQPSSLDDRLNPPMGLLYIAAYIMERGYPDVRVVDLSSVPEAEWGNSIGHADVYGCTMYTPSYSICEKIAAVTKSINPESVFVVGGAHPTALPHLTAKLDWVDHTICGEGELPFLYVLNKINNMELALITGITGRIELADASIPPFGLIDLSTYSRKLEGNRAPAMYTYRGCQYSCSFCFRETMGVYPRYYTDDHVDGILKYYKDNGYDHIVIWDSFFTNRRSRWYRIADKLHDMGFTYRCNGKIGVDGPEDFKKLVDTGCVLLNTGLESGSQYIIDRMNKRFTIDQARDYVNQAKDAGLILRVFLQFGFPGETRATMEETLGFIEDVDIDQYSCFTHNPFPGCETFTNPPKFGITWISENWDDYYTIAGTDGLGGMPFETEWLKRDEAIALNVEFVQTLRTRDWRGSTEDYHAVIGVGE